MPSSDHGGTLDWNSGGKTNAIMQLSMKVAKLETFVRELEKDAVAADPDKLRERLTKQETRIDILESRLTQGEQQVAELDDLKSAAKYANPKMIGFLITLLLGGSVASNTAIETIRGKSEQQHDQSQDIQLQRLMDHIDKQQQANN